MSQIANDKVFNFKVQNDTSYYFDMLQKIASGSKYTAETHDFTILQYLRESLFEIMAQCKYRYFTREYGIRHEMKKFTPDDYFNFMYNFIKMQNPNYLAKYVKNDKDKYYVSNSDLTKIINDFCSTILEPLIRTCKVNLNLFSVYDKRDNIQPQNVVYNPPSNKCREAVLSGKQTNVRNSSFCGYGMYAYSDVGKRRSNQEDSYYIGVHPKNSNFKLMVVADGMGGHENGEIASNIVVAELIKWFEKLSVEEFYNQSDDSLKYFLDSKISEINEKVRKATNDGGSTLCLSIIKQDSILMGNIGDSQGYVVADNDLIYATTPENVPTKMGVPNQFTRFHNEGNVILNCVGGKKQPDITFKSIEILPFKKYRIVLCSDGVSDCLAEKSIIKTISKNGNPAESLVETAIENTSYLDEELKSLSQKEREELLSNFGDDLDSIIYGGKDNTTAVVADIAPKRRR